MHRVEKISGEVIRQAWCNWLDFHHGLHCEELETRFFKYLHPNVEDSYIDDCVDWDDEVDYYYLLPHTANYLMMAASPHHKAIFKAYYVNHPWQR